MAVTTRSPASVFNPGAWTNPGNVYSSNGTYATLTASSNNVVNPMQVRGFDFSAVGATDTIDSVQVTIEADDAGSGVDRIRWRTPETFWGVYQEPFTRQLRAQEQVLEVVASDRAGNETARQRVVLPAARP